MGIPSIKGRTGLIIETSACDQLIVTMIGAQLRLWGCDTVGAVDSVAAASALMSMESPPDFIVCPAKMLSVDGVEFIRKVRAGEYGVANAEVPIILGLDKDGAARVDEAKDAGATSILPLPLDGETLLELLAKMYPLDFNPPSRSVSGSEWRVSFPSPGEISNRFPRSDEPFETLISPVLGRNGHAAKQDEILRWLIGSEAA